MTLRERIQLGCEVHAISQAELARRAGMPNRQYLYRMMTGEKIGRKYFPSIACVFDCRLEWLTIGSHPPHWASKEIRMHEFHVEQGAPSLHDVLVRYFGGEPEQIRISNRNALFQVVDLEPLMRAAGGPWLRVLRQIEKVAQ